MMKTKYISLAAIATLLLTLGLHINVAQAGLVRGTDLQVRRSIDNDDAEETKTSNDRDRSMEEFGLGWNAYQKDEHLNALEHFYEAAKIDSENPYAYLGLALVSGKTSKEGVVFMTKAAELFEREKDQEGYDLAVEWLQTAKSN
jgi:hypothetical protein